jgi:hypothetical protein
MSDFKGVQKMGRNGAENRHLQAKVVGQKLYRTWTEIEKFLGNFWATLSGGQKADEIGIKLYQFFTMALPENDGKCRRNDGVIRATKRRLKGDQKCHRLVTNVSPVLALKLYHVCTIAVPKNCIKNSCVKVSVRLRWKFGGFYVI